MSITKRITALLIVCISFHFSSTSAHVDDAGCHLEKAIELGLKNHNQAIVYSECISEVNAILEPSIKLSQRTISARQTFKTTKRLFLVNIIGVNATVKASSLAIYSAKRINRLNQIPIYIIFRQLLI